MWWSIRKLSEAESAVVERAEKMGLGEWNVIEQRGTYLCHGTLLTLEACTDKGTGFRLECYDDEHGARYTLIARTPNGSGVSLTHEGRSDADKDQRVPRVAALYGRVAAHFEPILRREKTERQRREREDNDEDVLRHL